MRNQMNIVETIRRDKINGGAPSGAEYGQLSKTGFIQGFYRFNNVKFNDGTNKDILQYWGEQGGWHPSNYNTEGDIRECKFVQIIDA